MELLRKIRDFIQELEKKDFYKYLTGILAFFVLLTFFMMYRYSRVVSEYSEMIEDVNDLRNQKVKTVLERLETNKKQREAADAILREEENFFILDYYTELLKKLRFTRYNKSTEPVIQKDLDADYRESKLSVKLGGMNTKELCELLHELELKKRIKIRDLEIRKSKKRPRTIDVDITISTLLPKIEETT